MTKPMIGPVKITTYEMFFTLRPTPATKSCPRLPKGHPLDSTAPNSSTVSQASYQAHTIYFSLKRLNLDCEPTPEAKASTSCVENDAKISVTNKHLTAICHGPSNKNWVDENQIEDVTTKVNFFQCG